MAAKPNTDRIRTKRAALRRADPRLELESVELAAENPGSWKPQQERLSARYTTRWDDIIEVKV